MVDQSELAFRLLCRELGTGLAYTPMLHARLFNEVPTFRQVHFDAHETERPGVFAQFAGHDPLTVLEAARKIEDQVDAVDLNFGCPQGIARKGRYGAFLMDEPDVMVDLVSTLAEGLNVPVTAKLRLLPSRPAAIALCKRLEDAGASVVCLHGRTREQNKQYCGSADWDAISECVKALSIPVVANGGIATAGDVAACLEHTGAAAVMSSEALLENPALFCRNIHPETGEYLDQMTLAHRYLEICEMHPPGKGAAVVRGHLFKMLHNGLRQHTELRDELLLAHTLEEMRSVLRKMEVAGWDMPNFHLEAGLQEGQEEQLDLSWYRRYRNPLDTSRLHGDELRRMSAADKADQAANRALARQNADGIMDEPSRADMERAALEKREAKRRVRKTKNKRRSEAGSTRKERNRDRKQALMG